MDIMELGAIGEFVASIAVLVTLICLVLQMRQNTIAIKRSNVRQVTSEHVGALKVVSADSSLSDIMFQGWIDLEELNPVERYRFDLGAYAWLASVEQAFADHELGLFPDDSMVIFRNNIPGVLNAKGGAQWWSERQIWFSKGFRNQVDRLLQTPGDEYLGAGVNPIPVVPRGDTGDPD